MWHRVLLMALLLDQQSLLLMAGCWAESRNAKQAGRGSKSNSMSTTANFDDVDTSSP
jgi:hypothetical protein